MTSTDIPMTLSCKKCGGNTLITDDNPTSASRVICKSCGTDVGSWGSIRRAATDTAKKAVEKELKDTLRKAFKGNKNIRIK